MYVDYSTQKAVIDFNRSNDKYRVDLIDYSEYNTEDDYNAGLTKFNTEIFADFLAHVVRFGSCEDLNGGQIGIHWVAFEYKEC